LFFASASRNFGDAAPIIIVLPNMVLGIAVSDQRQNPVANRSKAYQIKKFNMEAAG